MNDIVLAYRESAEGSAARELLARHETASFAGLPGAATSFFLPALLDGGPHLVVVATQEEAEELVEELEVFCGRTCLFFPPWESLFAAASVPDEEIFRDRLRVLRALVSEEDGAPACAGAIGFIVAPVHALLQPVPAAEELQGARFRVAVNAPLPRDGLAARLAAVGFRHVPLVIRRGEFSVRGDIVDLFPHDADDPIRVEYFGDVVDSIREFGAETQRSLAGTEVEGRDILLAPVRAMFRQAGAGGPLLLDLLPEAARVVAVEPDLVEERLERVAHNIAGDDEGPALRRRFLERLFSRPLVRCRSLALGRGESETGRQLGFRTVERFRAPDLESTMERIGEELARGTALTLYCDSDAEGQRIRDILADHDLAHDGIEIRTGTVRRGFECGALRRVVLATGELLNRRVIRRARKLPAETRIVHGFFDLEEGDLVVHLAHGIGRYLGVRRMETDGVLQEFLVIEYRNRVRVHVPASKIDLVQKYIGKGAHVPPLDRVGGASWSRRKETVAKAIMDYAADLLEIQAVRRERPGIAYPADDEWQRQLEAAFPFEDTPDQGQATEAVKADLEAPRPMDRLLCGDVGYGKTEIAMRAAFKVVNAGRQVVALVPTTVLAQQHCRTFRERMAGFPIRIEQLSRFCSGKEQRATVAAARAGEVDILIGTHRVLSDDVGFKDLGLVIIDEEQRFGVGHKEKLKRLRATVDILTLTATPIPRTLHMALLGIRDISSLSTPPEGRSPIHTEVIEFDRRVVREAILRELTREGQIYFVHNRVQDIALIRHQLQQVVPEAVIEFAHGQMTEHELEEIMMRFLDRRIDVLVSTTIIETGIDIPTVNTIFIDECDRFGIADLHQLRGRVGRSRHRAYCYLIMPEHRHVNPDARKRIHSIREFSQLGAGFQIALRDLEIRGAGNILGAEQSGHIAVVGYDLYCRLLEKAVKRLRGEETAHAVDVELDLTIEAYLPEEMVPEESVRLDLYRRVSRSRTDGELEEVAGEIRDRYGALPRQVENLIDVQRLRMLAARRGIRSVGRDGDSIALDCAEAARPLLDACPLRTVVLGPGRVAIVVNDHRRRRRIELDDELVFRTVLTWLESGVFPDPAGSPGVRRALEAPAGRRHRV